MEYFEAKERLNNLKQFRSLYREYIDFTNRETNVPAQIIKRKLEPLAGMAVDSLQEIGLGRLVTREAASEGGRKIQINIIKAIFRPKLIKQFRLDDLAPLDALDEGLARYQARLARHRLQLFNPFFWLYHFIGFVARLPLMIFSRAGYDTRHAETLTSVRGFQIVVQIALWYLLFDAIGLIDRVRLALIPFMPH
jgi:hypothetical protein